MKPSKWGNPRQLKNLCLNPEKQQVTQEEQQIPHRASAVQLYLAGDVPQPNRLPMPPSHTWWGHFAAWPQRQSSLPALILCCWPGLIAAGSTNTVWWHGEGKPWAPFLYMTWSGSPLITCFPSLKEPGWHKLITLICLGSQFKYTLILGPLFLVN